MVDNSRHPQGFRLGSCPVCLYGLTECGQQTIHTGMLHLPQMCVEEKEEYTVSTIGQDHTEQSCEHVIVISFELCLRLKASSLGRKVIDDHIKSWPI